MPSPVHAFCFSDCYEDEGNARYRLTAMAIIDGLGSRRSDAAASEEISTWWAAPWAVRIAISSMT